MSQTRMRRGNSFAPFAASLCPLRLRKPYFNGKGRKETAKGAKTFRTSAAVLLSLALVANALAATLPAVQPAKVAMSAERLAFIDAAVNEGIEKKETPGAVVLVARRGGVVWRKAYGARAIVPQREAMTADTIFDLASLTKIVATATSVMILVERGKLRLNDPVSLYIPELKGEGREEITIEHLLTHRSGFAPTENVRGMTSYLGGTGEQGTEGERVLRGEVHDPTANRMGGVAGHAGLFSTADDLAIFCQMIMNGGEYGGVRILSPLTVAEMTRPRQVTEDGGARGLGWDINTSFSSNRGDLFPVGSFGHTGFTGTSIWIDPASETFVVFLSNRVHPDGKGDVSPLRARVVNIAAAAVTDDATVARARLEQSQYVQEMAAGLARFTTSVAAARAGEAGGLLTPADAEVLNGIDVLERDGFKELQGMRVGLITNQTGRDRGGRQTIDALREAPGVKLTALFSPEHGIRGLADEKVSDTFDEKTGLPIYSLYGETRRPKPGQLKNLDALVYDIQDVGARFYTYISTLGYALEEASKAKVPFFVLDRPNPINGADVEGPVADADKLSFTAYHTIPVRHGMTVGELAQLYNAQRKTGCDLRVVKMENWRRAMWFDATGQTWVNPSPNMRSLTEAMLYPGVGLLETTNLSVGRGTDTPFELVGAPWLDGRKLAAYLNGRALPGVRFVPVRFTPRASVFKGEECGGVNIAVIERTRFRPVRAGLEIAVALRRLYPQDWKVDDYIRLLANADPEARLP